MLRLPQGKLGDRLAVGERGAVILDEHMRLCVAHLFAWLPDAKGIDRLTPFGTAFFVNETLRAGAGEAVYVVTARHVVEAVRATDSPLILRVNRPGSDPADANDYVDFDTDPNNDWICHPLTDVAVVRLNRLQVTRSYTLFPFPSNRFAQRLPQYLVTLGEEVVLIGLFAQSPGTRRNEPIVRFGRVSRLLGEKLSISVDESDRLALVDAYLVEAISWGGQSGSPVFLYISNESPDLDYVKHLPNGRGPWLLGLVHGYPKEEQLVDDPVHKDTGATVPLNAGLTVVIPAISIRETLDLPQVREERENPC